MNKRRIIELVELLPRRNAYTGADRGAAPANMRAAHEIAVRAQAVTDPSFGWALVRAHIVERRALPVTVTEPELNRVYDHFVHGSRDESVSEAFMLQTSAQRWHRVAVQCMLLVKRCDYGRIAEEVEISEDAVRIYSETFWNVRDRLHESIYISSILYPDTTQITWAVDYHLMESPAMLALRIAHRHAIQSPRVFHGEQAKVIPTFSSLCYPAWQNAGSENDKFISR